MERLTGATPRPWHIDGLEIIGDGMGIAIGVSPDNMKLIVQAVNSYEELKVTNAELLNVLKDVSIFFKMNPKCLADSDQRIIENNVNALIGKVGGK